MEKTQSTEHSDFLNRYSILIDDIKYLKSRQWTITYYLLLLYAAIIGFYKLMGFDDGTGYCIEKSVFNYIDLFDSGPRNCLSMCFSVKAYSVQNTSQRHSQSFIRCIS